MLQRSSTRCSQPTRDIERFSTYVGQGAIRFYLPIDVALPNDYFAQSVVVTKGLKERDQVRARLEQALAARFPEWSRASIRSSSAHPSAGR